MKDSYPNISSYLTIVAERISNTVRLSMAIILCACWTFSGSAQINEYYNFNNNLQSWVSTGSAIFTYNVAQSCDGIGSARSNVFYNATNAFRSPLLGNAVGELVTVNFDYKVLNYYANEPTAADKLEINGQWSNSTQGPWTTFFTYNSSNHITSANCVSKIETFTPSPGPLYIRFENRAIGQSTDIYFYYDNVSIIEGAIPSCLPVESVSVLPNSIGSNSFAATWVAAEVSAQIGYEYEVRTSGEAGSGNLGLAASGIVDPSINSALINGLNLSTVYTIYVRAKCGADEFSVWRSSSPVTTLCGVETVPYNIPFATANVLALPNCISIQDVNNDSKTWKSNVGTAGIIGKVMQYIYSPINDADDWFYTSALHLESGVLYRLTFKYKTAGFEEKLAIAIGSSATAISMTTILDDITIPVLLTQAVTKTIDFTPQTSGTFYLGFQAHSAANKNSIFVGEVALDFAPTCSGPSNIAVSNIDKNSATISWVPSLGQNITSYNYEIRTSGQAGSGDQGLISTAQVSHTTNLVNIIDLIPDTTYYIYVIANCSLQEQSDWTSSLRFKTLCDYDEFEGQNTIICEGTSAILEVIGVDDQVNWYKTQNSNIILATGHMFITPQLSETTTYFAKAFSILQGQLIEVGHGAEISSSFQNPFYSLWSNSHTQHLIRASELLNAGMAAGPLHSVALTVTDIGTVAMKNLSIKIGSSSSTNAESFINNDNFSTVFSSQSFMPIQGVNVFQFNNSFQWDGISNIVIEFCHYNPIEASTMSRSILADQTSFISTVKSHLTPSDNIPQICSDISSNQLSYKLRPLFTFNATIICENPNRVGVTATVLDRPVINAENIQLVNVTAMEDATLADLEPSGENILWFASYQDAIDYTAPLPITTQLNSGDTYYAILQAEDCYSLPFPVTVTVELGLASQSMAQLKYYPNPVKDQLFIKNDEKISAVEVFNSIGQKMLILTPNVQSVSLDVSSLRAATYILKITTETSSKTLKLIKQ